MVIGKRKLRVKSTSDKDETKSVFIPSDDWKAFKKELESLKKNLSKKSNKQMKPSVLNDLKEAFQEVALIKSGKLKPKSAKDFLREL